MSGMSGIMLLERLAGLDYCPPAIMLTAHGDAACGGGYQAGCAGFHGKAIR
jgi:FixJ family two-component response regulator